MSRLFAVILKCFKLLDMSYFPMQNLIFPRRGLKVS
jgi:hypothetical protein